MTFPVNAYRPVATPDYLPPTSYLLPTYTPKESYVASHTSLLPPYKGTRITEYDDYVKYKKDKDDDDRRKDSLGLPVLGGDEKGDGGLGTGAALIGLLVGQLLPALLGGKDGKEGGGLGGLLGGLLG